MTRKRLIPLLTAVALAALAAATAVTGALASTTPRAVSELTAGRNTFSPNASVQSSLHYVYHVVTVKSGGWLTFKVGPGDTSGEPHTMTVVNATEVPRTVDEVFNCGAPCDLANGHFATNPPTQVLNAGKPGFDQRGDSLLVAPGPGPGTDSATVRVTAPAGTDLHFICAFHPWMQGVLQVR